jgi:Fe-S-cluster-containing hydrogenase component 2
VQALKCDLCSHTDEGPACVAACPTQALRCMEPSELERLSASVASAWRWRCSDDACGVFPEAALARLSGLRVGRWR